MAWEQARNKSGILLPLPPGEGWGEGIKYINYFAHVFWQLSVKHYTVFASVC